MNYLEWATKLFEYYFNEDNNGQEVILYCDDEILNEIGGENGKDDFLNSIENFNKCNLKYKSEIDFKYLGNFEKLIELISEVKGVYLNNNPILPVPKNNIVAQPKLYYSLMFPLFIIYIIKIEEKQNIITSKTLKIKTNETDNFYIILFNCLNKLGFFLSNENLGFIRLENLFGKTLDSKYKGKYEGYFKYHAPFTRQQITEIIKIKNRNGIYREIIDNGTIELTFKEILDNRFKNNREIGYRQINNVISGRYKIPEKKTEIGGLNPSINKEATIFITPSFTIENNTIKYFLRIHSFECDLWEFELNIKNEPKPIIKHNGHCFKVLNVDKWPEINEISVHNLNFEYINPINKFFIPIKENQIWNHINREEFIASPFSIVNSINYFKSAINNLNIPDPDGNWFQEGDFYKSNSCKKHLTYISGKFISTNVNSHGTNIILNDNGFYIDKHSDRIFYLYYLLPKVKITKQENETCWYKINEENEIEVKSIDFELNTLINLKGGDLINIYINDENSEIIFNKKIQLVSERQQIDIEQKIDEKIKELDQFQLRQPYSHKEIFSDIDLLDKDFLSRMLYSLSNYDKKRFELNHKFIYKIMDEILQLNNYKSSSYLKKQEVFRNLIALGYIIETDKKRVYKTRDLALLEINSQTIDGYQHIFRLSGARNLPFIKELISIAQKIDAKVEYVPKVQNDIVSLLLPYELYFLFKDLNAFNIFIESNISQGKVNDFVRIVPHCINDRIINKKENTLDVHKNYNNELQKLDTLDLNSLNMLIDGKLKLYKSKNTNNDYWIYENNQYIKTDKKDWASMYVLKQNEIPLIYTKYHTGDGSGMCDLYVPIINETSILPQEYYSDLVYLNGGVPDIISIENNPLVNNSFGNSHSLGNLFDLTQTTKFQKFSDIKGEFRTLLAKQLSTNIGYINF